MKGIHLIALFASVAMAGVPVRTGYGRDVRDVERPVLAWRSLVLPPWSDRSRVEAERVQHGFGSETTTTIQYEEDVIEIRVEGHEATSNRVVYTNGAVWESYRIRHYTEFIDETGEDAMEWSYSSDRYTFTDGTVFGIEREREVVNEVVLGEQVDAYLQRNGRPARYLGTWQRAVMVRRYQLPFK